MDDNGKGKVSIIMPSFNSGRFISDAIDSVITQTYCDWELLICDDESIDNSVSLINEYAARDGRVKLVERVGKKGAPSARNSCLSEASGRYIAFLDSDDIWYSDKLETQLRFMRETGTPFTFSSYDCMNEEGEILGFVKAPASVNYRYMLLSNFIGCLTVVYDREYFGDVRQPQLRKRNDYAMWLMMMRDNKGMRACGFDGALASYRVNTYGLSSNKIEALSYYWKCIRGIGRVGVIEGLLLSIVYLLILVIKKSLPNVYNSIISYRGR